MTTDTESEPVEQQNESPPLPVYAEPSQRHKTKAAEGMHPSIEMNDDLTLPSDYYQHKFEKENPDRHDDELLISSGRKLIQLVNGGECPVCGESYLSVRTNDSAFSPFIKEVEVSEYVDAPEDSEYEQVSKRNPVIEKLADKGYKPIMCYPPGLHRYYVGLASPDAVEEYTEWKDNRSEYESFRTTVEILAHGVSGKPYDELLEGKSASKGALLAAVFEKLRAVDYDESDLMGRENIKKSHLKALLHRLETFDHFPLNRDFSSDDWLFVREFGANRGVKWEYPQWVDTGSEDMIYDPDNFQTEI